MVRKSIEFFRLVLSFAVIIVFFKPYVCQISVQIQRYNKNPSPVVLFVAFLEDNATEPTERQKALTGCLAVLLKQSIGIAMKDSRLIVKRLSWKLIRSETFPLRRVKRKVRLMLYGTSYHTLLWHVAAVLPANSKARQYEIRPVMERIAIRKVCTNSPFLRKHLGAQKIYRP